MAGLLVYHTLRFNALIDHRLRGEQLAKPTLVYARPFEIRKGQRLDRDELVALLNDLGYRQQSTLASTSGEPGSFAVVDNGVRLERRGAFAAPIEITFQPPWVSGIRTLQRDAPLQRVPLEPVPVTTLFGEDRAKKRWVSLDGIPETMRCRRPRDRGSALLRPHGVRPHRHRPGPGHRHPGRRSPARREHAHPAAGEKLLPHSRAQREAEAPRSLSRRAPREPYEQEGHPGTLSERRLSRPEGLVRHQRGRPGGCRSSSERT